MLILITAMMLAPAEAAAPTATDENTIICKSSKEHQVGTRMKQKRTCMSKADWDYVEKQTQRELQSLRDSHLSPGRTEGNRGGSQ